MDPTVHSSYQNLLELPADQHLDSHETTNAFSVTSGPSAFTQFSYSFSRKLLADPVFDPARILPLGISVDSLSRLIA